MKLPSISFISQQAGATFRRFPFALINAAVGTIAAVMFINHDGHHPESILTDLMMTTALGISLLTTVVVFCEKRKLSSAMKLGVQVMCVMALAVYCYTLPRDIDASPYIHLIRFAILLVAMHFLAAAAPFAGKDEPNGFWQYNKTLFLRILTAFLYSSVLWSGLAIALQALHHLFDIDISHKRYEELWAVIVGIFNTWFFLAGVPDDLDRLNLDTEYPKGLKIFTQYILMPLIVVYLLILYAYMGKIVVEQDLPQGWVSKLILGFTITGILALLLVHPIKDRIENLWIRTVSKWYYYVLVPLNIMLLLAIWRRTSDYGITVNRYIVIVLGLWLTAITLYFIISRAKNIKVIPASLCIIAFLTAYGPWGAFEISEKNQLGRLEPLLAKNGILAGGKIQKASQKISFEDTKEISSIVHYLIETHGTSALQPWFEADLDTLGTAAAGSTTANLRYQQPQLVAGLLGIDYVTPWTTSTSAFHDYYADRQRVAGIEGFNKLVRLSGSVPQDTLKFPLLENISCSVYADAMKLSVKIIILGSLEDSLQFDLQPMMEKLIQQYPHITYQTNIPPEMMTSSAETGNIRMKIFVHHLRHQRDSDNVYGNALEADILIGLK